MKRVARLERPWRDPLPVAAAFAEEPWTLAFLSGGEGGRARWSYLLRRPVRVLQAFAGDEADVIAALRDLLGPPASTAEGPPFQGGAAGLLAYECGARFEPRAPSDRVPGWPDLACALYPALLAFDHRERRVFAVGRGEDEPAARERAGDAATWLDVGAPAAAAPGPLADDLRPDLPGTYEAAVADVVARIRDGEIFQANIARAWRGRLRPGVRPFDLQAALARASPAPFAAWFRLPDRAVASNSPERFLSVSPEGLAESRPIKGTRPRGADPCADARLARELAHSAKDRAENLMIVDLMRNDLSRVCAPGAVAAPELFRIESYPNVHHLVSTVTGRLAPGRDALDLLAAAFPPGSVTGAPKLQAMSVIARHEPPRGPYCGSLFWAGADGAFDASVLIRTAALVRDADGWGVEVRAGAGIVADSDPRAERLETEAKVAALRAALLEPS